MAITYIKSSPSRRKVLMDIEGERKWIELESYTKPLDGAEQQQLSDLRLRILLADRNVLGAELLLRSQGTIGAV